MVQSSSWEANWFAASQKIPRISQNPKVHYRTHKRPPPVSILGQPYPVHIPTSHLLEIHPNNIHPSTPRSSQWSLTLRFPHQDPIHPPHLTQEDNRYIKKEIYCKICKIPPTKVLWSCWTNEKPKNFNKIATASIGGTKRRKTKKKMEIRGWRGFTQNGGGKKGQALVRDLGNGWRLHWKTRTTMGRSAWWWWWW